MLNLEAAVNRRAEGPRDGRNAHISWPKPINSLISDDFSDDDDDNGGGFIDNMIYRAPRHEYM